MKLRKKTNWCPRLESLEDRLAPATHTWTGLASGNPNWTVASNWQSHLLPTTDGNAVLVFPSDGLQKATTFNNFALGTTFKSIILQSNYDIKGNRLHLGSGGLSTTTGTSTFQADVEIPSGTLTISVPSGSLQIGGKNGGTISGAGGISKIGGNTLKLGRANTFSGAVSVGNGTVTLLSGGTLGTTGGNTTVENGGAVQLEGNISVSEPLVLKGQGVSATGTLRSTVGNNTVTGSVNLALLDIRIHVSAGTTLTVSGVISGASGVDLIKSSTGKLILSGANTYPGPTLVSAGILNISNNSALGSAAAGTTVSSGATLELEGNLLLNEPLTLNGDGTNGLGALHALTGSNRWSGNIALSTSSSVVQNDLAQFFEISGVISGPASASLIKIGTGNLTLAGANTYDGETLINSGKLITTYYDAFGAGSLGSAVGGTTVSNGATLYLASDTQDALNLTGNGEGGGGFGPLVSGANIYVYGDVSFDPNTPISPLSGYLVLAGDVVGTSLRKNGSGRLVLTGFVSSNIEIVSGTLANHTPIFGSVVVGPYCTFEPYDTVGGNITVQQFGTLFLNSPVIVNGSVSLAPDSNFHVRLFSPSQYAALRLDGTNESVEFNNARFEFDFIQIPTAGTQFQIIENLTNGSTSTGPVEINGTDVNQGGFFGTNGGTFQMNFTGGSTNDVVITKNTGTAAADLRIAPRVIDEGEETVLTGHLTDPNPEDQLTLVVDWRDGSPIETYRNLGTDPFAIPHRYLNQGRYPVHATWFDNHGEGKSRDVFVTVLNVAPILSNLAVTTPVMVGQTATLSADISDPGPQDVLTLRVDWGDGAHETFYYAPNTPNFSETHVYQTPGTFTIDVTLYDDVDFTSGSVDVVVLPGAAPGGSGSGRRWASGATRNVD